MADIERWTIWRSVHDGSAFVEGDTSINMRRVRESGAWESIEVVPASELAGAVEALEAFALDKWGTTNPVLVPDDEKPLQQAYYRAHPGGR